MHHRTRILVFYSALEGELFANVGSFYPLRKNFRLTPEVKEKFTEKVKENPGSARLRGSYALMD